MSFNSLSFFPFIALLLIAYWLVIPKRPNVQNSLLLFGSLIFLGCNDIKSACVIAISGAVNYFLVKRMHRLEEGQFKKWFFYFGCLLNVLTLAYFKYLNELLASIQSLFHTGTIHPSEIYLPLGLSFFTFQLIGYWIDVYNEETEPESNPLTFAIYLFYFPKLVSGPIERVQHFTPQLIQYRTFNAALMTDGMRQFLWGFFKKMVVSTHCLLFYKSLYAHPDSISGVNVLLASIMNMVYIYADFSGYSDMACGISKGFGIRITNNFAFPFFATNISEFWKRWHISLTSWIMNYVYTPVAFILRKQNRLGTFIAICAAFLTVGAWHGLRLGYILYGLLQAIYFLPIVLRGRGINLGATSEKKQFKNSMRMVLLFLLVCITALLFRNVPAARSFTEVGYLFSRALQKPDLAEVLGITNGIYWILICSCFALEWINRKEEHGLSIERLNSPSRWFIYGAVMIVTFIFSEFSASGFIYAQF